MFSYPLGHEFTRRIPDPCLILMLNDMPQARNYPG
jgi:hypothetical protein